MYWPPASPFFSFKAPTAPCMTIKLQQLLLIFLSESPRSHFSLKLGTLSVHFPVRDVNKNFSCRKQKQKQSTYGMSCPEKFRSLLLIPLQRALLKCHRVLKFSPRSWIPCGVKYLPLAGKAGGNRFPSGHQRGD